MLLGEGSLISLPSRSKLTGWRFQEALGDCVLCMTGEMWGLVSYRKKKDYYKSSLVSFNSGLAFV